MTTPVSGRFNISCVAAKLKSSTRRSFYQRNSHSNSRLNDLVNHYNKSDIHMSGRIFNISCVKAKLKIRSTHKVINIPQQLHDIPHY